MPRKLVHITLAAVRGHDLARDWARLGFALDAAGNGVSLADGVSVGFVEEGGGPMVGLSVEAGDAPPELASEAAGSFEFSSPSTSVAPDHPNGAVGLRAVVAIAESPADHAEYLSAVTGQREMLATSAGLEIHLEGGARLEVLIEPAFAYRLGVAPESLEGFRIAGLIFAVKDLTKTESLLRAKGLETSPHAGVAQAGRLLAGVVGGVAAAFEQA